MKDHMIEVFSIGHSNLSYRQFANLLRKSGIETVVDIRSLPYSKFVPHFNYKVLKQKLHSSGFGYVYLGNQLGSHNMKVVIQPDHLGGYRHQMATEAFADGVSELTNLASKGKVALMCVEGDPYGCFRHTVLSHELMAHDVSMTHILKDGRQADALEEPRHKKVEMRPTFIDSGEFVQLGLFEAAERTRQLARSHNKPDMRKVA